MGYTTTFKRRFTITPALSVAHAAYLQAFSGTRRMGRDEAVAGTLPDPVREAVGLPVGTAGGYFVGAGGDFGQDRDASILNFNHPPSGQPGLWCQWVPTANRKGLEWDGGEKFYAYHEWLDYLLVHFLMPWGYRVDGVVTWQGEERSDRGALRVINNKTECLTGPDFQAFRAEEQRRRDTAREKRALEDALPPAAADSTASTRL
jgi:hypothetical protein